VLEIDRARAASPWEEDAAPDSRIMAAWDGLRGGPRAVRERLWVPMFIRDVWEGLVRKGEVIVGWKMEVWGV
jgi:hypothetical protein